MFVWMTVCAGLVVYLSAPAVPGWIPGAAVAIALVAAIPLTLSRFRVERKLARNMRRELTTREGTRRA